MEMWRRCSDALVPASTEMATIAPGLVLTVRAPVPLRIVMMMFSTR
jgi:hypothetical protein